MFILWSKLPVVSSAFQTMPTESGGVIESLLLSETSETVFPLRDGPVVKAKKVRQPKASSTKPRPSSTTSLGSLGEKLNGSNLRSLDTDNDEDMPPANI